MSYLNLKDRNQDNRLINRICSIILTNTLIEPGRPRLNSEFSDPSVLQRDADTRGELALPSITPHLEGLHGHPCRHPESEFHPIPPSPGPAHLVSLGPTGAHTVHGRCSLPFLRQMGLQAGLRPCGQGTEGSGPSIQSGRRKCRLYVGHPWALQLCPMESTTSRRMSKAWPTKCESPLAPLEEQPTVPPSTSGLSWSGELLAPNNLT